MVQVMGTGTTAMGAFTLAGGEVRAGAFDYRLFRGGLDPSSSPNDWFLRSSFLVGPVPPRSRNYRERHPSGPPST